MLYDAPSSFQTAVVFCRANRLTMLRDLPLKFSTMVGIVFGSLHCLKQVISIVFQCCSVITFGTIVLVIFFT